MSGIHEVIHDLIARLERADAELEHMAQMHHNFEEAARLDAKASGVRLAISYAEEALR